MNRKLIKCFLIGAQKAGSTTLYSWLSQHPEINAPESIKDFHFFTSKKYFPKGYSWFEDLYEKERANRKHKLHGAVNYIFRKDAAQAIYDYNPDARLLVVLRDPVKRAFSAYQFFKKLGNEQRSFEQAIQEERMGYLVTQEEKDNYAYLEHGLYGNQLSTWLSYYQKKQMLIILYEELFSEPERHLKMIFEFMGVQDTSFKVNLTSRNVSGEAKYPWLNRLIYNPEGLIKRGLNLVVFRKLVPTKLKGKLLGSFRDWNTKEGIHSSKISEEDYQRLSPLFEEDRAQLEEIIGKKLNNYWKY